MDVREIAIVKLNQVLRRCGGKSLILSETMEFFNNHKELYTAAFLLFFALTLFVCIVPALNNQRNNAPLPNAIPLSEDATKGKAVFISNGCVACHTQQVRNIDMDKMWGSRPNIAADYANNQRTDIWRNTATLMGTERTGSDRKYRSSPAEHGMEFNASL